jgi:hydroxyacylglutathione hydrolase
MEIVPGIHIIDGIREVNCYLIINGESLLLIDTGVPGQAKKAVSYLHKLGKKLESIRYIILTHADIDHIGSALDLKKMTGAKVAIHSGDAPVLTGRQKFKTMNNCLGPAVGLVMRMMRFQPLEPDIVLKNGDQIEGWQIIHTPGHTRGSICLYQPGQHIFVGDALRTGATGIPRPISRRICVDLRQTGESLSLIANLNYINLFPGHGAPITGQGALKIKDMFERYKNSRRLVR